MAHDVLYLFPALAMRNLLVKWKYSVKYTSTEKNKKDILQNKALDQT